MRRLRVGLTPRRGARPVGIDNSPKQLETAARLQREHGIDFPLLLGKVEQVPYPDVGRSTCAVHGVRPPLDGVRLSVVTNFHR